MIIDKLDKQYGWYCPLCNAIYFHPDADNEHEDLHESVEVVSVEWLKRWIEDAEGFGLNPDEIVTAIKNNFQPE